MTASARLATLRFPADGRAAAAVLRCAADVALVIGPDGLIRETHIAPELRDAVQAAPGSVATEIVRAEDREAFASGLAAAATGRIPEPLEVRHIDQPAGAAIRYAALPADGAGDVLLIGRLLPRTDALALNVSEARLAVDRDDLARRASEARYQMLFEGAAEAILLVGVADGVIEEANPQALALLGLVEGEVVGQPVAELVAEADRGRIAGLLAAVAERGEVPPSQLSLASSGRRVSLHGRAFRAFDRGQLMLCLDELAGAEALAPAAALVAGLMRSAGHSVALTDASGRIIWVSDAFPVPASHRAAALVGRLVGELFEGAGIPQSILGTARRHGRITCPEVQLRTGEGVVGGDLTVVALAGGAPAGFGLFFRADGDGAAEAAVTRKAAEVHEIAAAIGQAPLKDLVRDVVDAIERSCIEAALRLTGGNKAAAAEALGLSRQSLYLKLHRFGLI